MNEYELAGIETIARGICVKDGKILLCRAKGGATSYLPGGHIEFGENGREALAREVREELGVTADVGRFRGVVENNFMQHGKPHAEINLVYDMALDGIDSIDGAVRSCEDWIEFFWCRLSELETVKLLPEVFRKLGADSTATFEV